MTHRPPNSKETPVEIVVADLTAYLKPAVDPALALLQTLKLSLPPTDEIIAGIRNETLPWFQYICGRQGVPMGGGWYWYPPAVPFLLPAGRWYAFPAGLAFDVQGYLEEQGYNIVRHMKPPPVSERMQADERLVEGATAPDRDFPHAILQFPRGLLFVNGRQQVAEYSAKIAGLYPDAKIVFPVYSHQQGRRFRHDLSKVSDEDVAIVFGGDWNPAERCAVTTFHRLTRVARSDVDVLVVPNALGALDHVAQQALKWQPLARTYGFLLADRNLDPHDHLTVQAFIGPEIYRVPQWPPRAVVHVVRCDAPHVDSGSFSSPLERKQKMLYQNERRNRLIADLAYASARRDVNGLLNRGVLLEDTAFPIPASDEIWLSVVILVELPEHAAALSKMIPEAAQLQKNPDAAGTIRIKPRSEKKEPKLPITIITSTASSLVPWPADVVIRASGEACLIKSPNLPRILSGPDECGRQLLIDLCDNFDEQETRMAAVRRNVYAKNGWSCG